MKKIRLIVLFTLFVFVSKAQTDSTLRIIFIGDVMGHGPQINSARIDSNRYDYTYVFSALAPIFKTADYSVANLEVTLAGPPFTGYPRFSSPDELADGLIQAGVNVLVTANNHSADRGANGIQRTIDVLNSKNILFTGTFTDSIDKASRNPVILKKNDMQLALLNYTYGTNGMTVKPPYMVNLIDTSAIATDVARAKELGVDDIVVFIHWGSEYQRFPNKTQKDLAKWMQKKGVRIIIGSHPHVVQPIVWDKNKDTYNFVLYSLGNFVSNQRKRYRDGGIISFLEFAKDSTLKLVQAGYMPVWVDKSYSGKKWSYRVLPVSLYDSLKASGNESKINPAFSVFVSDTREFLDSNNTNVQEIVVNQNEWLSKNKAKPVNP
jgi:poly-gamma-glutamate synthesis protein (capsule biosynthesis protein)